ncbi:hypothetical protein [Blastococcus sp. TBT05-19]|uniref:hypothetical protein n=1 Tax=Blastococcus sp. TBT05-19 TaxID=2250581 RepID=UPI0018F4D18C|nr:hypothetical protein [Blastococcus sp. TBT05-19]
MIANLRPSSGRACADLGDGERTDDAHWVALTHVEGDFPGGVADLRYRFSTDGDLSAELVIAP